LALTRDYLGKSNIIEEGKQSQQRKRRRGEERREEFWV